MHRRQPTRPSQSAPSLRRPMLLDYVSSCPNCSSTNIVEDQSSGDSVCHDCGSVAEQHLIDTEQEWREFEGDSSTQMRSRVGGPVDTLTGDLSVQMSRPEGKNRSLTRAMMREDKSQSANFLRETFKYVDDMGASMELPERFTRRAKEIMRDMDQKNALRQKKRLQAFIAASLYVACRQESVQRSMKEIARMTSLQVREINRAYKEIQKQLGLDMSQTAVTASSLIGRIVNFLRLPAIVEPAAKEIADRSNEMTITMGKTPPTVAAASVYMLVKLLPSSVQVPVANIAAEGGITAGTVLSCVREMEAHRDQLIPQHFYAKLENFVKSMQQQQ